ncbi:hypothetical protein LTS18_013300, partial [Coniosporium uncinatum]
EEHGLPADRPLAESLQGGEGLGEGRVRDPHTGLPMNVGKYGTGEGGTDGSSNIHGYESGHQGPGHEGERTDWEGVKKANVPY